MKTENINLSSNAYMQLATGPASLAIESRNFATDTPVYIVVAQQLPPADFNGHLIQSLTNIVLDEGDVLYGRASGTQAQAIVTE